MSQSADRHPLRIELDTENCELSAGQIEQLERALSPLRKPVAEFPVRDLYVTVRCFPRTNLYQVKTALVLTGRTLATADIDNHVHPAFKRCVRKLVKKVEGYKAELSNSPQYKKLQKGTHQEVTPVQEPDAALLEKSVADGDYAAFRAATAVFEDAVRKRIGRWVQRYPELDAQIGKELTLDDVVEEVFLNAFERYDQRPQQVGLGEWLEALIDPSVKLLLRHRDEELENIQFARLLRQTEGEGGA